MAAGQINLIQLLSVSEEEFCPLLFFPFTKGVSPVPGFEDKHQKEIYILPKRIIYPVNNFLRIPLMKCTDD
jgi:hypothetical protein